MVNIDQFLKQAQSMQKKMQEMQEQMAGKEYAGVSGGGLVTVELRGNNTMKGIKIDQSLFKPEEKEMLEDLIVAAFNDAKEKIEQESQSSLSSAFGDIPMPPGFKMPF